MSDKFSYWGDGSPILLPDKPTGGFDYWGDGEPSPGDLIVSTQILSPSGIASEEAFGTPIINRTIIPTGIPSEEAFGAPTVTVQPLTLDLYPSGIPSEEVFGTPKLIHPGPVTLSPSGIPSEEGVGQPEIRPSFTIQVANWFPATLIQARNLLNTNGTRAWRSTYWDEIIALISPTITPLHTIASVQPDTLIPTIDQNPPFQTKTYNSHLVNFNVIYGQFILPPGRAMVPYSINIHITYPGYNSYGVDNGTGHFLELFQADNYYGTINYANGDFSIYIVGATSPGPFTVTVTFNTQASEWAAYYFASQALGLIQNRASYIVAAALFSLNQAINITMLYAAGIPSQEAFGQPTVRPCISPSGIVSLEAFGNPTITPGPVTIYLDEDGGIESKEAFGHPLVLPGPKFIYPSGIPSAEAFGTPTLPIRPEGIATEEVVGTPTITCGPVTIRSVGIASQETVGEPLLGLNIFRLIGVESEEAFGNLTIVPGPVEVQPSGIPSEEQVGTPKIGISLGIEGIPSEEAVGEPRLNLIIFPEGIISRERLGTPKIKPGPVWIYQRSIESEEMVGQPFVKRPERADLIVLEANSREDLNLVAGVVDLDLYRAHQAVEFAAGEAEIDLYWDEREVVNG